MTLTILTQCEAFPGCLTAKIITDCGCAGTLHQGEEQRCQEAAKKMWGAPMDWAALSSICQQFQEGECSPPSGICETTSGLCVQFRAHSAGQSQKNWSESSGDHRDHPAALRR